MDTTIQLTPKRVAPESMEPGKLYLWSRRELDAILVMLNPDRDGFVDLCEEDDWYFDDGLVGKLYGPIELMPWTEANYRPTAKS